MLRLKHLNLNLGIPYLIPAWKKMFSPQYFVDDLMAGLTVAFVAVPLSLAIALASGVEPGVGLITAIVAGIVCALFGGTPLAVSGPAAAMSVLIADVAQRVGIPSLILICAVAGVMQLISGILGLGRYGRYVPLPVISGFTAGIGVIIIVGQLPRAFGLAPPPESDIFSTFTHFNQYIHTANVSCLLLVAVTMGVIYGLPKLLPKVPAILPAVVLASLVAYFFNMSDAPVIGAIPSSLPTPKIPAFTSASFQEIFLDAFVIYLLASLETLLSSSAIDKLSKGEKHDSNQELIGQGLGNVAVSLFGGIPISGVIVRSATNIRAGAKTRRASILHAFAILFTIFVAAPLISRIPIAVLAGVLFTVAISMLNYKEFYNLWKTARSEAIIYAITFFVIIFVDLLAGVQAGVIAACIVLLIRASKGQLHITTTAEDGIIRITLEGSFTFLSTPKIANLQKQIDTLNPNQTIVLDLSHLTNLDVTGATTLVEIFDECRAKRVNFFIKGLARRFEPLLLANNGDELLKNWYLVSDHDLRFKIESAPKSAYGRLVHGLQRFYVQSHNNDKRLFEFISKKQDPHTLFITCSDSRIIPSLITSTDPGELFIMRNIGNYIPPYTPDIQCSEAAAIEFALSSFDISDIVVCSHANCGAMKACQKDINDITPTDLRYWINKIKTQLNPRDTEQFNDLACRNAFNQMTNLKTYPIVQKKLSENKLNIHAWFYEFDGHRVHEWDTKKGEFKPLTFEFPKSNVVEI